VNAALAQSSTRYYHDLARYQNVIAQKAALLRGAIAPDRELLLAYNDELLGPGERLVTARAAFVAEIAAATVAIYARWRGTAERLAVRYAPNTGDVPIADVLAANVDAEIRRRRTLAGPHRDDLELTIDGRSLAAYGSQGQQRTAVLALKVAEYEVMRVRGSDAPILLLDDVLSELDTERAAGFLAALSGFEQAFLTATELPPELGGPVTAWTIDAARVTRFGC
jgi:DNA replication and repair protein RecF